ncbi:MAG TPA: methyltransferase domain-containing protein [Pseudolabrys sp.]|jgi:cyclopropane fatty-acyl-phospholipid synthase-like methyltransferase|nr:methyltransferase domain-containing protein [Pseudolabrys sp.]
MSELERWQERYATDEYRFGTAPNAFLAAQANRLPKSGKALAIADGEGRNGVFLAERGLDVLSLDFSPNGQAKARKLAAARGVTIRTEQADVINWGYPPDTYEVVAAIFFQFVAPAERDRIFAGIKRTLKKGGLLLLEGYGPKQLEYKTGGPGILENLYTREILETAFGDLATCDIREYDAELHEGAGHGGMSALVDLVAVK